MSRARARAISNLISFFCLNFLLSLSTVARRWFQAVKREIFFAAALFRRYDVTMDSNKWGRDENERGKLPREMKRCATVDRYMRLDRQRNIEL